VSRLARKFKVLDEPLPPVPEPELAPRPLATPSRPMIKPIVPKLRRVSAFEQFVDGNQKLVRMHILSYLKNWIQPQDNKIYRPSVHILKVMYLSRRFKKLIGDMFKT